MNKDLYIQLLEEHVDDLTTDAKIDGVLSSRQIAKIRGLKIELESVRGWNKVQEELVSKVADTALDYKDALNELKIKHIEETQELRQDYLKTLEIMSAKHTRANDENVRLRGKIAVLEEQIYRWENGL